MYFVDGDLHALRERAARLHDIALSLQQITSSLRFSDQAAQAVDDTRWVSAYTTWESRERGRISDAANHYSEAGNVLGALALTLERIEREGSSLHQRLGSPSPGSVRYAAFELAKQPLDLEASHARHQAESQLERLATQSPAYVDTSTWGATKSYFAQELHDLPADLLAYGKETATGLYIFGKFLVWDGSTIRLLTDPAGWERSWQGVASGIRSSVEHPSATVKGLIDYDLLKKNPFAWGIIVIPSVLVGIASDGGSAGAKLAASEASQLSAAERVVRGLETFKPNPAAQDAAWTRYVAEKQAQGLEAWPRDRWDAAYQQMQQNKFRGDAFRDYQMERLEISDGTNGWQKELSPTETEGARRLDFGNRAAQVGYEIKSGRANPAESLKELGYDEKLLRKGWQITWILEEAPDHGVLLKLQELDLKYEDFSYRIER